jgi:hypothetical protein
MGLMLVLFVLAMIAMLRVEAQQYGSATALLSIGGTNATATATNVSALSTAVTLTKYGDFDLEVIIGVTNAATGTYDLRWSTSNDGTNYATSPAAPGASGWFSIPLTNAGTRVVWRTNIVTGAGYWRVDWATNASGQHATQQVIRPWIKPSRYGN